MFGNDDGDVTVDSAVSAGVVFSTDAPPIPDLDEKRPKARTPIRADSPALRKLTGEGVAEITVLRVRFIITSFTLSCPVALMRSDQTMTALTLFLMNLSI